MLVVRPVASDSTDQLSPLQQMTDEERLIADFHGSGTPRSRRRKAASIVPFERAFGKVVIHVVPAA
jgi:hypothetical protein